MIAVFDSGYGGLTVLKPLLELLPEYDYMYLGDNARAPYGGHSAETITAFSEQAVKFLLKKGAKIIVFACNSASATALPRLKKKYGDIIIGVITPAVEKAVSISKNKRIGVVGTKATIASKAYEKGLKPITGGAKIYTMACPLLVPLIEESWHARPEAGSILKEYLKPLKSSGIDTLILGCTHYPIMLDKFKSIMGKNVNILTSGIIMAENLKTKLKNSPKLEESISKKGKRVFLTTDDPEKFRQFAVKYLHLKIKTVEKVTF